jgi:hypothetical protein
MSLLFISRVGQTVKFQTILSAGEEGGATLNERLIPDVLPLITGSCLTATSNAVAESYGRHVEIQPHAGFGSKTSYI